MKVFMESVKNFVSEFFLVEYCTFEIRDVQLTPKSHDCVVHGLADTAQNQFLLLSAF